MSSFVFMKYALSIQKKYMNAQRLKKEYQSLKNDPISGILAAPLGILSCDCLVIVLWLSYLLILFRLVLCCVVMCLVLSFLLCLVLSLSCLVFSWDGLVLSCIVLPCGLSCLVLRLSCPVLCCVSLVLSCGYLVLSCLVSRLPTDCQCSAVSYLTSASNILDWRFLLRGPGLSCLPCFDSFAHWMVPIVFTVCSSRLVLSLLLLVLWCVLRCVMLPRLGFWCDVFSCLVFSCLVLFLSSPVLSCRVLSCFSLALSGPTLPCLVLTTSLIEWY